MYEMKFPPFIGIGYHRQSPKILILGESHYRGEGDHRPDFTSYVVHRFAKRERRERRKFFTNTAKCIDTQLTNETAPQLWDRVAFYNYVQVLVGNGPRQRPTTDMFDNSKQAFIEVVEQLKPDIIVILGITLGRHLKSYEDIFSKLPPTTIVCEWAHPSSPKYFKARQAIESFNIAKKQFEHKSNQVNYH